MGSARAPSTRGPGSPWVGGSVPESAASWSLHPGCTVEARSTRVRATRVWRLGGSLWLPGLGVGQGISHAPTSDS